MTCPSCGSPGAYVGLAKVECDYSGCMLWWTAERRDKLRKFFEQVLSERRQRAPEDGVTAGDRRGHSVADPAGDAGYPKPGATDPAGSSSTTGPS